MGISRKFIKFVKFIKPEHILYFLTLLFCLIIPGFVKAQNNPNDIPVTVDGKKYYRHTVTKGETIYGIAQKFSLQPKDIVLENPSAIDGVHPGDVLMIPNVAKQGDTSSVSKAQQMQGNYIYHEVIKKETLYSLSKKYNTTVSAIDSLNPGLAGNGLRIGQTIRIPVMPPQPTVVTKPKEKHTPATEGKKDTAKALQPEQKPEVNIGKNETEAYKTLVTEQTYTDTSHYLIPYADTGRKLNRYNVALIMPFAAGGSDTIRLSRLLDGTEQIPLTTQISVDFYHGIILAFDSLAKKGLKANLYIFNILSGADSSSHSIDSILKNPEMLQMNLIIGPPSSSNFKRVAKFAALHHIAIVSPLSGESSVLKNNPWTSKMTPSTLTETEFEADYIASHYSGANIIIIHNKDADDGYYQAFKKRFKKTDSALNYNDTLRHAESISGVDGLKDKITRSAVNVIVMPYQGAPYIAKFVNELANSKYSHDDSLIMFGMHNWSNNDALAAENLDTLDCHFPSNEFVNYGDSYTSIFIAKYRSSYLSEPSYYSYEGYDAGMFYGSLLQTFGTDIQNHLGDSKYKGLQTSFDMFRSNPTNGYENKAVYILEYRNYTEKMDLR